jgi:hypothetical protein
VPSDGRRICTIGGLRSGRERKTSYAGRTAVCEGDAAPATTEATAITAASRRAVEATTLEIQAVEQKGRRATSGGAKNVNFVLMVS